MILERRGNASNDYERAALEGYEGDIDKLLKSMKAAEQEVAYSQGLVCYSERSAASYTRLGFPNVKVVHLGAEPFRGKLDPNIECPTIGFVGRPDFWKGFDRFVELIRSLSGMPMRAIFVGDRSPWAMSLLPKNVESTGRLNRFGLEEIWRSLDYLILPSRVESFGLVAYEALSRGVIPLVSEEAGVSETLTELSDSCVFGSIEEAAETIRFGSAAESVNSASVDEFCKFRSWARFGDEFSAVVSEMFG